MVQNYYIIVTNNNGQSVRSSSQLSTSAAPVWSTAAGSLGTVAGNFSGTVATVAATGDTIVYSETTKRINKCIVSKLCFKFKLQV